MKIRKIISKNMPLFMVLAMALILLAPMIIGKICEPLINTMASTEIIHCHDIAEYSMFGLSIEILIICAVFLVWFIIKSVMFVISYEKAVIKYANWDFEHIDSDETTAIHYVNRLKHNFTYNRFGHKHILTIKLDEFIAMVSALIDKFGVGAINDNDIIAVLNLILHNSILTDKHLDIINIICALTMNNKPSIIIMAQSTYYMKENRLVLIQPDKLYASKDFDRYVAITKQNATEIAESIIENDTFSD